MSATIKVSIDGKEYEIDLEKYKSLGLIKEIRPEIKDFEVGDIFTCDNNRSFAIIIKTCYSSDSYSLVGLDDSLLNYANVQKFPKERVLNHLNTQKYIKVGNINDTVKNYLQSLRLPPGQ